MHFEDMVKIPHNLYSPGSSQISMILGNLGTCPPASKLNEMSMFVRLLPQTVRRKLRRPSVVPRPSRIIRPLTVSRTRTSPSSGFTSLVFCHATGDGHLFFPTSSDVRSPRLPRVELSFSLANAPKHHGVFEPAAVVLGD